VERGFISSSVRDDVGVPSVVPALRYVGVPWPVQEMMVLVKVHM